MGEQIEIDYDEDDEYEENPIIVFGLTDWGAVPKKVREFCKDDYEAYKMFILSGCKDEDGNVLIEVGIYRRKLWSL